ncbi:MAG: helix-turn-helix domain-containing protein [Chloroflexota bacterium]|nr:helix-turn-helix domain-containing protein [Chloroflexota bacterium]
MRSLREHRRSRFISIEDLAEKAGVSTKTIVETELGRTQPKFRTIRKISEALGVDPGDVAEFAAVITGDLGEAKKLAA